MSNEIETTVVALPAAGVRGGRIAPLQEKVLGLLRLSAQTVSQMALTLECSERDVRLAIDRARAKGYAEVLKRTEKGTFALVEAAK